MKNESYVHRDSAITQTFGGGWGILSIILSLFTLGMVSLIYIQIPRQESTFDTLMLYWFSSVFLLMGLHQGFYGFRALFKRLHLRYSQAKGRPYWQLDYPWQSRGAVYNSKKKLLTEHIKVLFFTIFLAPFLYLVYFRDADTTELWVKVVVAAFVLIIGLMVYSLRTAWYYHFRHGSTTLKWEQCPLEPGVPFSLELINQKLLNRQQPLNISVRYIEEVWVSSGKGKNRSNKLMFLAVHDYRQVVTPSEGRLRFSVCLPENSPTNAIASGKAAYWELVVHNSKDLNWHPYLAWFFLPVYSMEEKAVAAKALA
ncbi:hypothetical protein [Cesiribacter sp. SM1]|uniref:hypothetical protein n=1 Tax=Cesiribacter sp. SM1 TaxID=2861196 RepID=UPI001CD51893|nr:hypothetical protein [Cesiribacter sp. SM1]